MTLLQTLQHYHVFYFASMAALCAIAIIGDRNKPR